jgi:hypothetical protein
VRLYAAAWCWCWNHVGLEIGGGVACGRAAAAEASVEDEWWARTGRRYHVGRMERMRAPRSRGSVSVIVPLDAVGVAEPSDMVDQLGAD